MTKDGKILGTAYLHGNLYEIVVNVKETKEANPCENIEASEGSPKNMLHNPKINKNQFEIVGVLDCKMF